MRAGTLGLLEPTSGVLESLLSAPSFLRISTMLDDLKGLFILKGPAVIVELIPAGFSGVEPKLLVKTELVVPGLLLLFPSCFDSTPPRCSSLPLDNTSLTAFWPCSF